jgi:hypothetical protein
VQNPRRKCWVQIFSKHINIDHKNACARTHIAHDCVSICSCITYAIQLASAASAVCIKRAKKLIYQCATISGKPIVLLDLSPAIHTLQVEKKTILSLVFIERSPESEEGGGDKQMMSELLFFQLNPHTVYNSNTIRNLHRTWDLQTRYIAGSAVTDTFTHRTTTAPLTHAPRFNYSVVKDKTTCSCIQGNLNQLYPQ